MKEEGLNELHECFKNMKYIKGMEDIFDEIDTVQDMIDRKEYIKDLVVEIES